MSQSANEINDLLESWGLSDLKSKFKVNYIVLEALDYLTEADIKELIPKIGQRAIFRARLYQWRQEKIKPPQLPTAASEENCVPEPKKIKLEPDAEEPTNPVQEEQKQQQQQQPRLENQQQHRQIPQEQLQQQQLQQEKQSAAIEQMILKAKAHLSRKGTVTPKNIIAKPTRGKRGPKKFVTEEITQVPTIQSRVQQFIIGSSTPSSTPSAATTTTSTVSPQTAATPTGVCRISKLTSPNNSMSTPRLTVVNPITSPSMFYNSQAQPMFEGRRIPTMATARLISPGVQQQQPSPVLPKIKVIKSDNLSPPKATVRITPANFDADLTPFATSIIRVETNDNESAAIGGQSAQNLLPKMKRTTIIQKLKDKNTSTLPISPPSTQKPLIMSKPIVQIQKLAPSSKIMSVLGKSVGKPPTVEMATLKSQLLVKSPVVALKRSPEVPKPKVIMIPKTEPADEEEQSNKFKRQVKDWYSHADKKGVDKSQIEPAEPDTVKKSQHDDNEREEELEMDPDTIPEIEEITLADPIAELPDAIKDEVLDSDSHSDPEADQEQDNSREGDKKDDVLKENSYSKDSQGDSTEFKGDIDKLDIRKVLTNSKCGRKVIKRYVAEEVLDETIRKLLIETIAFYCFENKIHITPTSCKDIAEQIIEIFPNERMEDYFQRKGKKLRSPLYTKYLGIKRESYRKQILNASKNSPNGKSTLTKENEYDEDDNLIIS